MSSSVRWFVLGTVLVAAIPVLAEETPVRAVYPALPEKYDVHIRYRIRTDRDERIRQFRAMQGFLKQLGFVAPRKVNDDLEELNPDGELLTGTIPSASAAKLFDQPNIRTVILAPAGANLLADPKATAQVRIQILNGYPAQEQRRLHEQVIARLGLLGFKAATGYDHREFSTIRGAIPAAQVLSLLKDLRTLPAGYFFGPFAGIKVPQPFASVVPVRVVEVLPPIPATAVTDTDPGKFTADLAAALTGAADKPLTVEMIFDPDVLDLTTLRSRANTSGQGVTVNGVVGPIASVRLVNPAAAANLARIPGVLRLRLPRSANETLQPATDKSPDFLTTSRLSELHKLGYTGTGTKLVIIGSSFGGWEKLLGNGLPKDVKHLDLTSETDPLVMPLPLEAGRASGGLAAAVAAHRAAPGAALHLVRVDPAQMHQILTVLRAVNGDTSVSIAQQARLDEATVKSDQLRAARRKSIEQYRKAFNDLSDAPIPSSPDELKKYFENGPMLRKDQIDALNEIKKRQQEEAEYTRMISRYTAMKSGLEAIANADVVANTLVWEAGAPHDGLSQIGRELDAKLHARAGQSSLKVSKLPPPTGWVQAGGTSTGQVWTGPWMDRDGNGTAEFTNSESTKGQWMKELNFLDYAALGAKSDGTLPAGLKVRISVQWREPHDPNGFPPEGSIFPMRLRVLRQLDVSGKMNANDEFVEVARAQGEPVRIAATKGSETFEHFVDVTIPAAGAYAVRVEGSPKLEKLALGLTRNLEPRIRMFVELLDAGERAKGKVTFRSYPDDKSGVGVPGDSMAALTVGTPSSLTGLGPGVTLGTKPDAVVDATVTVDGTSIGGPAVATGYAAGLAATLAPFRIRPTDLMKSLGLNPGKPLVIPAEWLAGLPSKTSSER